MIDALSKYQKYLLALAVFLSMTAVSISIDDGSIDLQLKNYPLIMILLIVISIGLIILYTKMYENKLKKLSNEIRNSSSERKTPFNKSLVELTTRQRLVYDQILSGKSNKEIMQVLFIEQSTLKTHINQIYKKLNIKSRNELKTKANQ